MARGEAVAPTGVPKGFGTMSPKSRFRDRDGGERKTLALVCPEAADVP